jgi:hypothetical protein
MDEPLEADADDEYEDHAPWASRLTCQWIISTSASLLIHFALVLVLGLIWLHAPPARRVFQLTASVEKPRPQPQAPVVQAPRPPPPLDIRKERLTVPTDLQTPLPIAAHIEPTPTQASMKLAAAPPAVLHQAPPPTTVMMSAVGTMTPVGLGHEGLHGELGHRVGGDRYSQALLGGGNRESEDAVDRGLKWLAQHQFPDGSWSFEHSHSAACAGRCTADGQRTNAHNAATGLALLCFLGAGQTHFSGKYPTNVQKGLQFLVRNQQMTAAERGSFWEPNGQMYGHGIATMAMCEAYALTAEFEEKKQTTKRRLPTKQERESLTALRTSAQAALDFIAAAQDLEGGGWRYNPRQAGDTSVFGWQLLALKSGYAARLHVSQQTIHRAYHYLDLVQSETQPVAGVRIPGDTIADLEILKREVPCGPFYGYDHPGRGPATTAIGLLSRMYLGWDRYNPALVRGVETVAKWGPSRKGDMYFNYYGTLLMWHVQGAEWRAWNDALRDWLVQAQATEGHELGSWFFAGGDHGANTGGRLYYTALSILTLEIYYRFLPLYRRQVKDKGFTQ